MLLAKCVAKDISGCDGPNLMKLGGCYEDVTRMMHVKYFANRSKNAEFTIICNMGKWLDVEK